jgi:ABC-type protease/lipase transport system fused ATPase/permease subunit
MKEIKNRWNAPTPKFWKKVQKIGMAAAGIATVIATAPVALPVAIVAAGGYLAVASGTIAIVSQLTIEDNKD